MTPDEHRAKAEELMAQAWTADDIARAQVHATLALAPAPPPSAQPQQTAWDMKGPEYFATATGGLLSVTPARDKSGVVLNYEEDAWLMEDPTDLRNLASLLTAHANRLESKP